MNKPIHVLFIEDNPGDARLVKEELQAVDYKFRIRLEWVDSLEKGLGYFHTHPVDAVLLDLSLPDSTGLETLQRVLACAPQTPVIVMTGLADEEVGMKALQAGAQDYLIKGEVDGRLLTRAIQYAIQRKQTEMQLADALVFTERILTSSPIGIFTYRLSGECLSANAAAAQMVGATVEQLKSQNFHRIESWKKSGLYDLAKKAITSKELVADDIHVRTTFGKDAWYRAQFVTFISGGEELLLMMFSDITERKYTEAALESSEKRFRTWIEYSSDIVTVVDASGIIQYESPSVKRLLDYEPEELMGKNAFEFVHPADQERITAHFGENFRNLTSTVSAEFRFRHRDGSWRFLEGIGRTYVDEHDEVVGLIHSRDITERKEAEEKIILQANLLNTVGSAAIATNLDGRVIYWNPAAEKLYGWSSAEAFGRPVTELIIPHQSREQAEEIMKQLTAGNSWSGEFPVQRRDGSVFPAFVSDSPLLDANGKLIGIIGVSNDISALKQVEAALKASEQRHRDFVENFPNGVVSVYNRDFILVFDAGLELKESGYKAEDFIGKHFTELAPPETWEIAGPHLQTAFDGNVSAYQAQGLDGQYYSVNVAPLRDSNGEINEILVVSQNITTLKKAEFALQEKEHLLSEAQRIGHIGSWSYDIRCDVLTFSDEMYRLLDVRPDEFHHNSEGFLALVYPSDRPMAAKWFADIKEGTQAKDLNFRLFHKNGELCYLYCTGAVEFDAFAKPARFIGTVQDVTERRVAEIQIDQQIKRLTALSEIDRAIISSFDQKYTLRVILSHMISQLQVDAADVLLLDSERNVLSYAAGQGFRTKMMEPVQVRMGESHAGRAARERRMIRIPDLRETTNLQEFNSFVMAEGFVSYIAVPLVVKGNIKGVLEVYQRSMLQPYQDWLEFFNTLVGQTVIAIENTNLFENLRETNMELVQAYDATIEGWSRAMDLRDRETEGHTQRVTSLTIKLARALGMDESNLLHIRRGALLHDIGKLGVPDHILFKPGALSEEEREVIEKHVEFAYDMLAPIPYLKPALNIPYFHHEKWDGTGYPLGLKGEQIPLEARIFAIVDVWDALLSDRPYRKAWTQEQTVNYIRAQTGSHFDPRVVECFLKMVNKME